MNKTRLLVKALDASQQSKKSLMKENLQYHQESTTKLARTVPTWEIETGALKGEVCWTDFCILLWFLIYESKMDQN